MDSSGRIQYLAGLLADKTITVEVFNKLLDLEKENAKNNNDGEKKDGEKQDGEKKDAIKNNGAKVDDGVKNDGGLKDSTTDNSGDKSEVLVDLEDDDTDIPAAPTCITSGTPSNVVPTNPFRRQIGKYDPTKPMAATTQALPAPDRPRDSRPVQPQSPRVTTKKGGTPTEGQLIDISEEGPQGGGTPKREGSPIQALGLRLEGMNISPRESRGQPTNNKKQPGAQVAGPASKAKASKATTGAQVQRASKTQKGERKVSNQLEKSTSLQEGRLQALGLTSDEALRFACPWDMYLRLDGKKCTDVSCPFNHGSSGNLEYKPLMCPFWAGKAGKHARCTKSANMCKLAHFECGHKQYGALPPNWVIRK